MTIVCCWLNQSYSLDRMTAIADERAAVEEKEDVWKPLTETTVKLFRLTANCHVLGNLRPEVGGWTNPYYHTEIGIGFAGYCFEALTIIALLSRVLDQLVADSDGEPKPDPDGILNLARHIIEKYFEGHKNPKTQHVEFLIFGFSSHNGAPWVGKLVHKPKRPTEVEFIRSVSQEDFFVIGDPQVKKAFRERVDAIRRRIAKRAKAIQVGRGEEARFEAERESGRLLGADRKAIESEVLKEIDNEFVHTVGGVLQKIEVYRVDSNRGEVGYTRDTHLHLLNSLPCVGAKLGYIPIEEKMGINQAFGQKGEFSGFDSEGRSDFGPPNTFLD